MKTTLFILVFGLLFHCGFSQESKSNSTNYNMFDCQDCKDKFFVASNSGVANTPLGLRVGFLCKTGAYLGTRFGTGEVYQAMDDTEATETTLFSITAGLIKPVYIQNEFGVHAFLGAGYGQWWPSRQESWTKEGFEIEGGFMTSYKRFMVNISANVLNGYQTYATWDFTIGLGYRF